MNLQEEFYQVMTRVKANSRSRAASTPDADARVTEMVNGLLVSKPAATTIRKEPEVIDLQEYARSRQASVPNINKIKAIQDFINGKH